MAQRSNHYEAAFEKYLRQTRIPHVAVDERRRSLLQNISLKSLDYIVYSSRPRNLLVDVKGRRFPSGTESSPHKWENWATEDDLEGLLQWQQVFGDGFRAVLVFAYHVIDERFLDELDAPFEYQERTYSFYGVWADDYWAKMRPRSTSWNTVSLPSLDFRKLCSPIDEFL